MDGLEDILNQDPQEAARAAATHQELERQSQDLIRVANPTDVPYTVKWGGYGHLVPARHQDIGQGAGQAILPRYIAFKYVEEMTKKIATEKQLDAVAIVNKKRIDAGREPLTKYDGPESEFQVMNAAKSREPNAEVEIASQLVLGIEQEFGLDAVPTQQVANQPPALENIFNALTKRPAPPRVVVDTPSIDTTEELPPASFDTLEDITV